MSYCVAKGQWGNKTIRPTIQWWCHLVKILWWDVTWCLNENQWEFEDPKMELLYHTRPYVAGILLLHKPYIGLIYGRYLQFRFLKWPLIWYSKLNTIYESVVPNFPVQKQFKKSGEKRSRQVCAFEHVWRWEINCCSGSQHDKQDQNVKDRQGIFTMFGRRPVLKH